MKQQRWLIPVLILSGFIFLSPARARGDSVSTIEQLLDVVHDIDSSIPSGSTLDPVLRCLQDPKGDLDACANAIGGDGTSTYMDSILDVIQIFEDIAKSDYDGVLGVVVKWVGSDAPCIVADIMFPGVGGDLCELAKELIEAAVEVGQDIAVFFADVGEGLYDVGKAVYCAFADCSSGSPPQEPPQQVIYETCFVPQLDNGLHALENKGYAALEKMAEGSESGTVSSGPCHMHSIPNVPDLSTYFYQAGEQFKKQVQANWAADMPKTVIPQLLIKRQAIGVSDAFQWWLSAAGKMAQAWADPNATVPLDVNNLLLPTVNAFSAKVAPECVSAFAANTSFAEVDTWIKDYPDQAKQIVEYGSPGLMTNAQWCELEGAMFGNVGVQGTSYQPPNCPAIQKQGSPYIYRCNTLVDYGRCWAVEARARDVHSPNPCGFNVPVVGKQLANSAWVANCKVSVLDNSPTTDTPVLMGCQSPGLTSCAQAKYTSHYKLPVTLVNFQTTPDPQYAALIARVNAIVWLVSHGQDPHGNLGCPPACSYTPGHTGTVSTANVHALEMNQGQAGGEKHVAINGKAAETGIVAADSAARLGQLSNDALTGKVKDPSANRTAVVTGAALPKACLNRIQVSDLDPLIVYAEVCVANKLRNDPNQDFGFKGKNQEVVKWFYAEPGFNNLTVVKEDYHPTDCSSVSAPILVDLWPNSGSELILATPH
jgi:hypothetical protein